MKKIKFISYTCSNKTCSFKITRPNKSTEIVKCSLCGVVLKQDKLKITKKE